MHAHEHDVREAESLRPKGSRLDERPEAEIFSAAASGRTDVLGPDGMLRMQRAVGNAGAAELAEERSPVLDVVSGGGRPLDEPVRQDMQARLGADFSDVRVHADDAAHRSAQAVGAHAYTVGSNVVFQRDKYDPQSTEGRTMLAHELTHVIQQRSGPVDGTPTGDGVSVSDPSDRFERAAAENAERAMAAPAPAAALQRAADEEEELQLSADPSLQRAAEQEDELQLSVDPSVQREQAEDEAGDEADVPM